MDNKGHWAILAAIVASTAITSGVVAKYTQPQVIYIPKVTVVTPTPNPTATPSATVKPEFRGVRSTVPAASTGAVKRG